MRAEAALNWLPSFGFCWPCVSWEGRNGKENGNYYDGLYRTYPFISSYPGAAFGGFRVPGFRALVMGFLTTPLYTAPLGCPLNESYSGRIVLN